MSDQRINHGGPAFPQQSLARETPPEADESGMSLRDWFAGHALAMLADPNVVMGGGRTRAATLRPRATG
jgi:hypothetical protein